MSTARNGAASDPHTDGSCDDTGLCNSRWGYVESAVAGLVVILVVGWSLPMLLGMTQPFGLFATTALATVALAVWIGLWAGLSLLHNRIRAARRTPQ